MNRSGVSEGYVPEGYVSLEDPSPSPSILGAGSQLGMSPSASPGSYRSAGSIFVGSNERSRGASPGSDIIRGPITQSESNNSITMVSPSESWQQPSPETETGSSGAGSNPAARAPPLPHPAMSYSRDSPRLTPSPRMSPVITPQRRQGRPSSTFSLPLSDRGSDARLSHYDLTSSHITPHLGEHANSLMPRIKTIELYRKNAKKANDPAIEFQLAQYMVQTALLQGNPASQSPQLASQDHSRSNSSVGVGSSGPSQGSEECEQNGQVDEAKLRRSLLKEALSSLRRLAERGHADSQYLLGDIYSTSAVSGKPDMEKSVKYFSMAAKHGHAEAAYRAGLCLQEGWGTTRDAGKALSLMKTAAVKNQPGALYQVGMAYFHHRLGIPDNSSNRLEGIKWLTRAVNVATDIYNKAPYELAKIYEVGYKDIVIPDRVYAVKLYARSAELNFIPAAAKLGRAYEFGELGCPQDASLSIHYYTIAALGNDPNAQLSMCAWYMVGAGPHFPINEDEAYEWALRAALNGLGKAMFTVAFFLENGVGCDRDLIESSRWYRRAAEAGDQRAQKRLQSHGENVGTPHTKTKGKCVVM